MVFLDDLVAQVPLVIPENKETVDNLALLASLVTLAYPELADNEDHPVHVDLQDHEVLKDLLVDPDEESKLRNTTERTLGSSERL